MQIFIKAAGQKMALEVESEHTVLAVKTKIRDINFEYIVFDGMRLQDAMTLSHYNIQNAETLQVGFELDFRRMLSGNTFTLDVHTGDSIDHVKHMVSMAEGIEPFQQRLIFAGVELQSLAYVDCDAHPRYKVNRLGDLNIQRGDVIDVLLCCRCGDGMTCTICHRASGSDSD